MCKGSVVVEGETGGGLCADLFVEQLVFSIGCGRVLS